MSMSGTYLTVEPTRDEIDHLHEPTLLEFGAPWCGHCLSAQPLIASVFEQYANVNHIKVEDGKGKPLGRSFRVTLWPTLIFLRDGKEITRLVRPIDKKLIQEAFSMLT